MNFPQEALDKVCETSQDCLFPSQGKNDFNNIDNEIDNFIENLTESKQVEMCTEAIRVLKTGTAASSQRKCMTKQDNYVQYLQEKELDAMNENTLINYMIEQKQKYSPGSLWCIFSIIGKWYKVEKGFNIKEWTLVIDLLKSLTKNHIARRAKLSTKNKSKKLC